MQHYAPDRVHEARQAPEDEIREWIADALATFGLTGATSWDSTGGKVTMSSTEAASAKVGPVPGHGSWADTFEIGNYARNLANGLGIPTSMMRIGLYSDSTMTMRIGKKRGACVHEFHNLHPHYCIDGKSIAGGAALRGILSKLR